MTLIALFFAVYPLLQKNKKLAMTLLILIPMISITLYYQLGNSQALTQYWALQNDTARFKQQIMKTKDPKQLAVLLKTYLEKHPDNPKGWYLLGHLYTKLQKYDEARSAFTKAYRLEQDLT